MTLFVTSDYCTSRTRCNRCRDQGVIGETWRATMGRVFELPQQKRDFDCPFSFAWGFKPLPPPAKIEGTTPEIERAKAVQGGCCGAPAKN